jgi:hypothetical protein
MQPTTKSDVYSFGVVLLELVTGKPAILRDPEPTSIIHWARQQLARGNIEGVVDPRMCGGRDVNSVWKAAEIALKCTAQASAQRPTMTDVVEQLQECLELEEARAGGADVNGGYYATGSGGAAARTPVTIWSTILGGCQRCPRVMLHGEDDFVARLVRIPLSLSLVISLW